jgi:hypothetical protein
MSLSVTVTGLISDLSLIVASGVLLVGNYNAKNERRARRE